MSLATKIFLLLCSASVVFGQSPNPIIRTAFGLISGTWKESVNGKGYASFRGIPYSRPPVGKYRFRVSLTEFIDPIYHHMRVDRANRMSIHLWLRPPLYSSPSFGEFSLVVKNIAIFK